MLLVCPECTTSYELPNALPDKGTKVRCTSCEHIWFAKNEDLIPPEDDEPIASEETSAASGDEIPAVSPMDEAPVEELDFSEILGDMGSEAEEDEFGITDEVEPDREEAPAPDMAFEAEAEPEPDLADEDDWGGITDDLTEDDGDEVAIDGASDENDQAGIDDLFASAEEAEEPQNGQDEIDNLFDEADEEEPVEEAGNDQIDIDDLFDQPDDAGDDQVEGEGDIDPFDQLDVADDEIGAAASPSATIGAVKKGVFLKDLDQKTMIGWASYGVCLLLIVLFAISARVSVVKALPAMAGIYEGLGFPVNVRGVMFTNVQQRWDTDGKALKLKVDGEIVNLTNRYKTLPNLVFVAMSKDRREVFRWVVSVRKKPLLPGEKAPFIARVPAPPETADHLMIRFE